MKRDVVLADCDVAELESFLRALNAGTHTFTVENVIANGKRTGVFSEIKRYGLYFWVGIRTFLHRKQYGTIVGWQQFFSLIYCFLCSVFGVKKCNTVIALNYTYKDKHGLVGRVYKWFMHRCMSPVYLDYIHVPSTQYADAVSRDFAFPRDRIIVACFGVNDCYEEFVQQPVPDGFCDNGYALAIGRSNRDYEFLIDAWQGIDYPLVIISDTYKETVTADNVTVLTDVVGDASHAWIAHCGVMILPIKQPGICSGDTVLLTAMAAARKVMVTQPSTLAEMYVIDGVNAVLTDKDADRFRTTFRNLLVSDEYADLGTRAREIFLQRFSRYRMGESIARVVSVDA